MHAACQYIYIYIYIRNTLQKIWVSLFSAEEKARAGTLGENPTFKKAGVTFLGGNKNLRARWIGDTNFEKYGVTFSAKEKSLWARWIGDPNFYLSKYVLLWHDNWHVTNSAHFDGPKIGMSRTTSIVDGPEIGMSQK